jgi:hypothetical protein
MSFIQDLKVIGAYHPLGLQDNIDIVIKNAVTGKEYAGMVTVITNEDVNVGEGVA